MTAPPIPNPSDSELKRLRRLTRWLDEAVRLPGGFRFGVDAIAGLLPGIGDSLGAVASTYIVVAGARAGVPTAYLLRMILNIGLDMAVGLIPLLGDLFDFTWKANTRNLLLIERGFGRASRGRAGERRLIALLIALVVLLVAGAIALSAWLLSALVALLASART